MKRYPLKTKDIADRVLGEEAIVVSFQNSFFYNLNSVGTFIWERCDGRQSLDQIAAALVAAYEIELPEAAQCVQVFTDSLVDEGLLCWQDEPEALPS